MVARSAEAEAATNRLFLALGDSTRRDIVRRVMRREVNISTLAGFYDMSFAAVQKHVAILERASLVRKERCGREQLVHGNVAALHRARRLLDQLEAVWRARIDQLNALLACSPEGEA